MKEKMICRGDLFYYDFGDNSGSVQSGERPVLVVQADDYNQNAPTIIVAAVTSVIKKRYLLSEGEKYESYVGWFFFAGGCICLGASGNVHTIPLTAYMQETISPEKMGRAFSVLTLISSVTMPIGLLFSSPIAEEAGVNVWFFISGLCMVILTACVSIRYSAKCRR